MKNISVFSVFFLLGLSFLSAQEISFSLVVKNTECNGANNGRAQINVNPNHPPYSFIWNTGSTANAIDHLAAGEYSVSITDSLENDTIVQFTIYEDPCEITPVIMFTPNGDGINDTWQIYNIEHYPDNLILVYNRWGQKVFEHSGTYEPWEGKDRFGIPAPDNSYFYIIYKDRKDEGSILKGSVSILR